MKKIFLIFLIYFGMTLSSFAWNADGHHATAIIAFNKLTINQQLNIKNILVQHPRYVEDFENAMPNQIKNGSDKDQARWLIQRASVWPDLVRAASDDIRQEFSRYTWHFTNTVVWLRPEDRKVLKDKLSHNQALTTSGPLHPDLNIIQALPGNLAIWRDKSALSADRAVALCWVLHMLGDLHQPLHNVSLFSADLFPQGDKGGNSVKVLVNNKNIPLHALWDSSPSLLSDLLIYDDEMNINIDINDKPILPLITGWLAYHRELAIHHVYTDEVREQLIAKIDSQSNDPIRLNKNYIDKILPLIKKQIHLAGHRIAALIDDDEY